MPPFRGIIFRNNKGIEGLIPEADRVKIAFPLDGPVRSDLQTLSDLGTKFTCCEDTSKWIFAMQGDPTVVPPGPLRQIYGKLDSAALLKIFAPPSAKEAYFRANGIFDDVPLPTVVNKESIESLRSYFKNLVSVLKNVSWFDELIADPIENADTLAAIIEATERLLAFVGGVESSEHLRKVILNDANFADVYTSYRANLAKYRHVATWTRQAIIEAVHRVYDNAVVKISKMSEQAFDYFTQNGVTGTFIDKLKEIRTEVMTAIAV